MERELYVFFCNLCLLFKIYFPVSYYRYYVSSSHLIYESLFISSPTFLYWSLVSALPVSQCAWVSFYALCSVSLVSVHLCVVLHHLSYCCLMMSLVACYDSLSLPFLSPELSWLFLPFLIFHNFRISLWSYAKTKKQTKKPKTSFFSPFYYEKFQMQSFTTNTFMSTS